jgi:UDP-3-O-acyl N-acetylglucosamine deacetylase
VHLAFSPAPAKSGVVFIKEGAAVPALLENVKDTRRGTSLHGIAVTEHLLAALFALGIDNICVEVRGEELPALDGSALPYVEALAQAGITEQAAEKEYIALQQPIHLTTQEASLTALPHDGFKVDFMVNFPGVGEQRFSFDLEKGDFKKEVAPARTFGYIEEYELLKERGLGQGASFENALVLGKDGYVNPPRFEDEPVRHKALDLIGDLALLGKMLRAEVRASRSGHELNIELCRRIRAAQKGGSRRNG